LKRLRFRFTKAKWNINALKDVLGSIAESFPESEVLIFRSGRNMPILDINVYVDEEQVSDEKIKEAEKKIFSVLTDYNISHVVFRGIKIFEVSREGEEGGSEE